MPKDSSAIEELVSLAQRHQLDQQGPVSLGGPTTPEPQGNPFVPPDPMIVPPSGPQPRPNRGGIWVVLLGLVAIGGAVLGGYILAQQESGGESTAMGASEADTTRKVPLAPPKKAAAPAVADAALADEEIVPDEGQVGEDTSDTGFDIFVQPKGAKVTVDGYPIGVAPLRVRNLNPGKHSVAIEGVEGYFGKHIDLELAKGEAKVLRLELESVDPSLVAESAPAASPGFEVASIDEQGEPSESAESEAREGKSSRKRSSARERRRKKKEEKRKAEEAAKKAEPAVAEESSKAEKVGLGTLMLGAKPPCKIIIDGKNTGLTTPQRAIQLPEGRHTVILVNDDHQIRKRLKIVIKAGRTTKAIQDLTKLMK